MQDPLHIVCGNCDAIVRLPAARLGDGARCPRCHNPLFTGKPFALKASNFDAHVARNDLPLVVDFWAPWCGPCRAMAPSYEQVARAMEPRLRFAKLNTEEEGAPAERHGIRSIPTLIVFRGGREVARESGAMDAGRLSRWLEAAAA